MLNLENKISKEKIANETFVLSNILDDYFGLIVLVLVLGIIMGSYFFVWVPRLNIAMDNISEVESAIIDQKSSLEKYKQQLISYKEAYTLISDSDRERISDVIGPSRPYDSIYKSDLLINYRDLLKEKGYTVEGMEVTEKKVVKKVDNSSKKKVAADLEPEDILPEGVGMMSVLLSVSGLDYQKLRELLSLIEAQLRVADIRNLTCDVGVRNCDINFDTYFFLSPEQLAKEAAAEAQKKAK